MAFDIQASNLIGEDFKQLNRRTAMIYLDVVMFALAIWCLCTAAYAKGRVDEKKESRWYRNE